MKKIILSCIMLLLPFHAFALETQPTDIEKSKIGVYTTLKLGGGLINTGTQTEIVGFSGADMRQNPSGLGDFGFGVGYNFFHSKDIPVRVSFEYTIFSDGVNDSPSFRGVEYITSTSAGIFNVYYDFNAKNKFSPYIGAGLGFGHTKLEIKGAGSELSSKRFGLAGNLSAGITYDFTDFIALDLGTRLFFLSEPKEIKYGLATTSAYSNPLAFDVFIGLNLNF